MRNFAELSRVDGTKFFIIHRGRVPINPFQSMATRIRLQRHGRKGYAFYSIVIADVRAPRDGKFTEKIGTYNPNTNPATVDLNFERALHWVECGAQPTDTVRNILSDEGVLLMKHLRGGVKKGAFDEAAAQSKFEAWKQEKDNKSAAFVGKLAEAKKSALAARLEAEKATNAKIAEKVAEKKAAAAQAAAEAAAETAEEQVEEVTATEEAVVEA
jgi:ribosomal protein S16